MYDALNYLANSICGNFANNNWNVSDISYRFGTHRHGRLIAVVTQKNVYVQNPAQPIYILPDRF